MKTLTRLIVVLLLVLASGGAAADELLIRSATVHTMGKDGVLENTDVLVADAVNVTDVDIGIDFHGHSLEPLGVEQLFLGHPG